MVNREMVLDVLIKEYNMYNEESAYNSLIGNSDYFNIADEKRKAIKRVIEKMGFTEDIDYDSRQIVKQVYGHALVIYNDLYMLKGE